MLNWILVATIAVLSPAFNGQDVDSSFFGGTGTVYGQTYVESDAFHSMEPIGVVNMEWNELRMAFSWGTKLSLVALNGSVPYWKVAEADYETPDWRKGSLRAHELPLAFDMYVTNWEWRKLGPYDGVPITTTMYLGLAESEKFPSGTVFTLKFFRMAFPYLASENGGRNRREFRMCSGTVYWDHCPFVFPEAPEPPEGFDPKTAYLGKRPVKPVKKSPTSDPVAVKYEKVPKLPPNPAPWLPKLSKKTETRLGSQVAELFARATAGKDEKWKREFAEKVARKAISAASKTAVPMKKRSAFAFVAALMEKEMIIRYR